MNIRKSVTAILCGGMIAATMGATHIVSENGGNFTSITAGITAAAKGDTLLIDEKVGGWTEDLKIEKGLTLMNHSGAMFKVNGKMNITTSDTVHIDDMELTGYFLYLPESKDGLLQITNCKLASIDGGVGTVRLLASNVSGMAQVRSEGARFEAYSNVFGGMVDMACGNFIGNKIDGIGLYIQGGDTSSVVKVIGNEFISYSYDLIYFGSSKAGDVTIANNFFDYKHSNGTASTFEGVYINSSILSGTVTIMNNTFSSMGRYSRGCTVSSKGIGLKVNFFHNHLTNDSTGTTSNYQGASMVVSESEPTVNVFDNIAEKLSNSPYVSGADISKNNLNNNATVVDAADANPIYNDIDGTRGDIGCEGGAYPFSSYPRTGWITEADRKPLVMHIEAPRRIRKNQKIQIKATGLAH